MTLARIPTRRSTLLIGAALGFGLTLAGVALCLTPRLTLPARLGGPGGPR